MIYFKGIVAGIIGALIAAVGWIVIALFLPIAAQILIDRFSNDNFGGGGAVVSSGSVLLAALLGFVAAFYWQFRRSSKSIGA
jgi:hypothetical protein